MTWEDFYKEIQETYHIGDEATVIKVPIDDVKEITSEAIFYKKGYLDTKKIPQQVVDVRSKATD